MNDAYGNSLPAGWAFTNIGKVVEDKVEQSGPLKKAEFTYVDIGSIDNTQKRITEAKLLPISKAPSRAKQVLAKDDVLVSMTRPNLNAVSIVPADLHEAIGSTGFDVLRTNVAEPRWLFYAVQSNGFIRAMCELVQGALYPAVRPRDIRAYRLPLAPINEQRRIVAKIEELFSDLDAGVAALERAKANLKRYRAAVLKAAIEGKLTEPSLSNVFDADTWKELGSVLTTVEQGWSPKCEQVPAASDSEWAVMKTSAIQPMRFLDYENKRLPKSLSPEVDLEVKPNDLLITRAGPRNRAAITCLVRSSRPRLIVCDKVYRMKVDPSKATGDYLEIVLNSPPIADELDELKTGISDSGVNLTQQRFKRMRIPLPPLSIQKSVVDEVEERLSTLAASGEAIEKSLSRAARLRQSILKQAFEGKLVPQDPNDESAGVMLERLRVGKSAAGKDGGKVKQVTKRGRNQKALQLENEALE